MAIENFKGNLRKKGETGNPMGRPVDSYKKLMKSLDLEYYSHLTKKEKYSMLEGLFELDEESLQKIASGTKMPVFLRITAKNLLTSILEGDMNGLELIYSRVFGKPTQQINLDTKDTQEITITNIHKFSDTELLTYLKEKE